MVSICKYDRMNKFCCWVMIKHNKSIKFSKMFRFACTGYSPTVNCKAPQPTCKIPLFDWHISLKDFNIPLSICNISLRDWTRGVPNDPEPYGSFSSREKKMNEPVHKRRTLWFFWKTKIQKYHENKCKHAWSFCANEQKNLPTFTNLEIKQEMVYFNLFVWFAFQG